MEYVDSTSELIKSGPPALGVPRMLLTTQRCEPLTLLQEKGEDLHNLTFPILSIIFVVANAFGEICSILALGGRLLSLNKKLVGQGLRGICSL